MTTILTPEQNRRKSVFERKMTLRKTNSFLSKPIELSFIDSSMMYNLVLRGIQAKIKNSFLIYDFSLDEGVPEMEGVQVIKMRDYPEICSMLNRGADFVKLPNLQKLFPKDKEEQFSKRMRIFNFIVLGSNGEKNEAFRLLQAALKEYEKTDCQESRASINQISSMGNLLSVHGQYKVNEKFFRQTLDEYFGTLPDECQEQLQAIRQGLTFSSVLRSNKVKEIAILRNSASHYFRRYPFFKDYLKNLQNYSSISLPNEVLCGRFFYGNWKHAASAEVFRLTGITHVVNITKEVENYFESNPNLKIKYLKIDIEDTDESNIAQHFKESFIFLREAFQNPSSKVFVHCAQGKSRSCSVVCVFFMKIFGWSYESTLKYVGERREIACPNPGFAEQLKNFELDNFNFHGDRKEEIINIKKKSILSMIREIAEEESQIPVENKSYTIHKALSDPCNGQFKGNMKESYKNEDQFKFIVDYLIEEGEKSNQQQDEQDTSDSSDGEEEESHPNESKPDQIDKQMSQSRVRFADD